MKATLAKVAFEKTRQILICNLKMAKILKKIGAMGEKLAEDFLRKKGFRILEKNFTIRGGELDLICEFENEIVFVEVKTRRSRKFGEIVAQISPRKIESLIFAAQTFLEKRGWENRDFRIDLITVFQNENFPPKIEHFENFVDRF